MDGLKVYHSIKEIRKSFFIKALFQATIKEGTARKSKSTSQQLGPTTGQPAVPPSLRAEERTQLTTTTAGQDTRAGVEAVSLKDPDASNQKVSFS